MPLPNAPDYSKRIYELLKETDLENLSYAQFKGVSEKLFIEPENEDEMRRVVLIQLPLRVPLVIRVNHSSFCFKWFFFY